MNCGDKKLQAALSRCHKLVRFYRSVFSYMQAQFCLVFYFKSDVMTVYAIAYKGRMRSVKLYEQVSLQALHAHLFWHEINLPEPNVYTLGVLVLDSN